jgi:hypothetical protein
MLSVLAVVSILVLRLAVPISILLILGELIRRSRSTQD